METPATPAQYHQNRLTIPALASLMIVLWFVPDLVRSPPTFPFQTITLIEGRPLAALLTPPAAGALLLLLFAIRQPARLIHAGSAFVGLGAVTSLILFGTPAFILGSTGCLAAALSLLTGAIAVYRHAGSSTLFYMLLGALPAALLSYAAYGIISDAYPATYLLPLKLPISIFAALSAAAISIIDIMAD